MRRTARILIAGAFGAVLLVGGGISASAITLPPLVVPTSASPSAPVSPPVSPPATPTTTPSAPPSTPPATPTQPPATPTPPASPAPPTKEKIKELFKEWNDALATLDPNKVADRYAPDAVLLPTKSNTVCDTREKIIEYFRHFLKDKPKGEIKESIVKILSPTSASDVGVYVFTLTKPDGSTEKVEARYTFIYELKDGKWVIVHHHSSAMPVKP